MGQKSIINVPIKTNLEPKSRLVLIQQGSNTIKVTVEQIAALKELREGKAENYRSRMKPHNKFKLMKNFNILGECEETDSIIYFQCNEERDDVKTLCDFLENNRGNIARERDFKKS